MSGEEVTLPELEREIDVLERRLALAGKRRVFAATARPAGPREMAEAQRLAELRDLRPRLMLREAARSLSTPTPGELAGLDLARIVRDAEERGAEPAESGAPATPLRRRSSKPGRPAGTGLAFPTREYMIAEYQRVTEALGREPSRREFADHARNAADRVRAPESEGVGDQTLRESLDRLGLDYPPS